MPSDRFRRSSFWLAPLLLTLLTWGAYGSVFGLGFVDLDDPGYVSENKQVLNGLTSEGIAYGLTTFDLGNWIPLTWWSLQLDATLFGPGATGFHVTSLLLHTLNVLLLYFWLRQLTGAGGASLAVAALFAVHPLHAESVAWISERKDVLSMFFGLLTLISYTHYARRPSASRYLLVLFLFAASLLSKPMLVTLPLLLLLVDFWPLQRIFELRGTDAPAGTGKQFRGATLVLEKLPLLAMSLGDGLLTIAAQKGSGAVETLEGLPLPVRLANATCAVGWYLWSTFVPLNLSVMYPHPMRNVSWGNAALSLLVIAAISWWAWQGRKSSPWRLWGWSWFLITLLPVIGILQVGPQAYADRYTYLPHVGLLTLIVWEWRSVVQRRPAWRNLSGAVCATVCLLLAVLTWQQARIWESRDTLWAHALRVNPANWFAKLMTGFRLMEEKQYAEAIRLFEEAYPGHESSYELNNDYAFALSRLGRWEEGKKYYDRAVRNDPHPPRGLLNYGRMALEQGDVEDGRQLLLRVLQTFPDNIDAINELGLVELRRGAPDLAAQLFERAHKLDPNDAAACRNLGVALGQLGRLEEAVPLFERAVRLNPDDAESHFALGQIDEFRGRLPQARDHYSTAARLNPDKPEAAAKARELSDRLSAPMPPPMN